MIEGTAELIAAACRERDSLLNDLPHGNQGLAWCLLHTEICDRLAKGILDAALESHPNAPELALVATGGYGRQEMAPYSDIDVTLIPREDGSPALDSVVRSVFQGLHEAFGSGLKMQVGYAYRLISDAPGLDARTRTGLLDARLVGGSRDVLRALEARFWESFAVGDFVIAKVDERRAMHAKHHATPLVAEPHLKEGAGGLRSFQCANWLRRAIGEQPSRPTPAYDHVVAARNLLHAVSGRANDILTRQRQAGIAEWLGVDPYEWMEGLSASLLALHEEYGAGLERLHESRYPLFEGVEADRGEARILSMANAGQAAVGIAHASRLGLRVSSIPVDTQPKIEGPSALYAVGTGEPTLRNLDRCGLLERLLPELTRCRTLMPRDTVHTFTVFEHTIQVVRNLDSLTGDSFLGDLRASLTDASLLYLAALLHDVGKFDPNVPHSQAGEVISRKVAERWNLGKSASDAVAWLVREHLTMARFIRIRDVQNPATVAEFAAVVGDEERLAMLTLLTWADINAVAPSAWTPSQEAFLRELYHRTADHLAAGKPDTPDASQYRQRLIRELRSQAVPDEEVEAFVKSLPAHYLASAPPEVAKLHLKFVQRAQSGEPTVEFFHQVDLGSTDVTVCAPDAPGLLSKLLGAFYAFDISVQGIRASTTRSDRPVALDVFTASFNGRTLPSATCRQIGDALLGVIRGERSVQSLLLERGKEPERRQREFSWTFKEGTPGVLEVRAARGRGMAYRLSRALAEQGWNVVAARVGQWAGSGAAAFYLLGPDDRPLVLSEVERALAPDATPG